MRNLLFGTQAWDIPTLAGVDVLVAGFALFATYLPARRAASVNPIDACARSSRSISTIP
jgi:macrolide transport system ATP-binding/permease protein